MRRVAVIVALGCFGSVLLIGGARTATVGPGAIAGFFAMAVLAPVALRVLEGPTGFRVVFAQCCAIGFLMAAALFAWTWLAAGWPRPEWHIYAAATACLAVSVVFGSAVAAALASKATSGHGSLHRRRLRDVGLAAALFFSCYSLMGWSGGTDSRRLLGVLSWAGFLAFFFAAVSVVVYLPLLLGLRRALRMTRQDILLASAGAVLFPIPLLAFPLLQGRLHSTWLFLLEHPGALLPVSLPYVLAGGLLGWLLADRTALAGRVHLT